MCLVLFGPSPRSKIYKLTSFSPFPQQNVKRQDETLDFCTLLILLRSAACPNFSSVFARPVIAIVCCYGEYRMTCSSLVLILIDGARSQVPCVLYWTIYSLHLEPSTERVSPRTASRTRSSL